MPDLFNIDAGDLRRRLAIQANTPAPNSLNQPLDSWSTVATVWGQIVPTSGQKFTASEQVRNATTHKVIIRYFAGLTPRHRILYGSRVFNILQVINEEEMSVRMTILAQEVV